MASSPATAQAMDRAAAAFAAGRTEEAAALCAAVLREEPSHFYALHLACVLALQQARWQEALDLSTRALAVRPGHPEVRANRGAALRRLDRHAEALAEYDAVLAAHPQAADARNNRGVALAALGRHEEAIAIWDELFELARELGRSRQVLLNYSSLAYRELYDLGEARSRSEEALELSQSDSFSMPRQFAGSDLLFTDLLGGDVGAAQAVWQARWDGIEEATAWTTWLIRGRLAVARAEIALAAETPESALEWAERSLSLARRTARPKYEARSLTLVGQSLVALKRGAEAVAALREATVVADRLIGAPARWQAWGALGEGAYACGDDLTAAEAFGEAWSLLSSFAATLKPERARMLLAAPQVAAVVASVPVAQRGNTQ